MNNIENRFCRKYINKSGISLLELIVAIIIIAIVVSGTVTGLAISYRSVLIGAEKDKSSSLSQKYCDVIMTAVQNNTDSDLFDPVSSITIKPTMLTNLIDDCEISTLTQITDEAALSALSPKPKKGATYFSIENKAPKIYRITTYVYYTDTAYITCGGNVRK